MLNATLKELAADLADRRVSSVELTKFFLARIDALGKTLNAFITVDPERSLQAARNADVMLAKGSAGPMTGIPIAHKDIFCTKGWLTTCGSRMLGNFVAPYDAHVIEQFEQAGAVIAGKTNMDEFAMGSSNETSFFGRYAILGTLTQCPAAARADQRQPSPRASFRQQPARIPADQSGSRQHSQAYVD